MVTIFSVDAIQSNAKLTFISLGHFMDIANISTSRSRKLLTLLIFVFLIGCSRADEVGRLAINGSVESKEENTKLNGTIRFLPKGNGPAATTDIANGKFEFTTQNGPLAGEYEVLVTLNGEGKQELMRGKKQPGSQSKEWKFSATTDPDKLELEPFVLSKISAVRPGRNR